MHPLHALVLSFFSRDFYHDAFHRAKGIGFWLLAILATAQTVLIAVSMHLAIGKFSRNDAPEFVRQIPELTFANGSLSTPEAKAYTIADAESGTTIAIIDTRMDVPPADLGGAVIFAARTRTTCKKSDTEQRSYDYGSIGERVITQTDITGWLKIVADWTALVCTPFVWGFFIAWRLFQLLFFSLVALLAAMALKLRGTYAATLRLTALALTPPLIVLGIAASAANIDFTGINLLFFTVVTGYIIFGTLAARDPLPPPTIPPTP